MIIDDLLPPSIAHYITQVSQDEHPDLTVIRNETDKNLNKAHMLSGPQVGHFLQFIIKIAGYKRCLELGTFSGYSALMMAMALPDQGELITIERDKKHADTAQAHFDKTQHGKKITLKQGDALSILPTLQGEFDLIFIDADKKNYPKYFDLTLPLLRQNGVMVADNALFHFEVLSPDSSLGGAIHEFNMKAKLCPSVETQLLSLRDGLMLIRKI